jgi:hypothetical protein
MKKVPSKIGLKKPQLSKVNSNLNNNIIMKREEEIKMKHLLNNKSHVQIAKTTRQLNPIQLKKTIRPPSQRTTIDCDTSSINGSNNLKFEYKAVFDFLKDLNMENYLDTFIKNGINSEEKILYLNNDNLKLINMPYAHRARFLKKLKEIETMQIMKKTITEKGGLSKVRTKKSEKNSKYEEIYIPKEEDDIEMNDEEQRDTFTQAIFDYQKTHSNFNNQENNELFSTGINNMNITGKIKKVNRYSNMKEESNSAPIPNEININKNLEINNNKKEEKITNNVEPEEDNKSKKSEGVGESLEPVEIGEYIENKNAQIKKYDNPTELIPGCPRVFFPLNKSKTLCYNCLHMILQEHCIQKFQKPFCSLHCLEIFEKKNVTNCDCCEKKIEIINSIPSTFKEKIYYCSPECLQKKEPNENMLINKSQIIEQNNFSRNSSETSENIIDILDL